MKWQYKTIYKLSTEITFGEKMDSFLNKKGEDGWELVQIVPSSYNYNNSMFFIFKKELK